MDILLKLKKEKNISSPLCINLHCIFKLILQTYIKMKKRKKQKKIKIFILF